MNDVLICRPFPSRQPKQIHVQCAFNKISFDFVDLHRGFYPSRASGICIRIKCGNEQF
nr:hypothetical protein [Oscillatoria laete-virens]